MNPDERLDRKFPILQPSFCLRLHFSLLDLGGVNTMGYILLESDIQCPSLIRAHADL